VDPMPAVHDTEDTYKQADVDGRFRRQNAQFRTPISKDGEFPPEKGRYLLYCALICPWACRTLIARSLKGLEDVIGM
jgi:glutathionyl-hydroquinone reductase